MAGETACPTVVHPNERVFAAREEIRGQCFSRGYTTCKAIAEELSDGIQWARG